ncbi:MAG TPA: alpha/beta hydrolase, partial [Pyrinomonadaceae bacterium]|nr:alpha/beta hydrolase [Pyrinomonadaceae bacterium]
MQKLTAVIYLALCLSLGATVANAQEERAGKLSVEPYTLRTFDGKEVPAELGRLWVRENRARQSGRLIQITFVRLKARTSDPGPPVVWLAGGPGVPGILMGQIPVYFRLFDSLRDVADVILLDQRGTGMSSPNLRCPAAAPSLDLFEGEEKWLRVYTTLTRACAEHWKTKGVDLSAYTADASADDVDDLRQALGAERLSLLGHSYGTVLAQAVVRRHGDKLHRIVLAATEGPDNLLALPTVWDGNIKKLSYLASQDAAINKTVPDLEALYRRVLDKLERSPAALSIMDGRSKRPVTVRVSKIGMQWLMRLAMSDARTFPMIPALLYTVERGDYSLLTRRIEALYNDFEGRSPMANATDCSEGWSAERLAQASKETPGALFSNLNLQWTGDICKSVGVAEKGFAARARLWSTIPTLFISGTLDANTPPFQAEEVRWGFPNSVHLVVENGGHETL